MPMSSYMRQLRECWGESRLLVPSVAGIVRDADNRLLLVQQRETGEWSTPGGAIELEDTPADAVVREVWEETGLLVRPVRIFAVYGGPHFVVRYSNGDETQYISAMFECEVVSGDVRADGDEIERAHFWSLAEARRLPLAPWLTRFIDQLFEQHTSAWFEPATWSPDNASSTPDSPDTE